MQELIDSIRSWRFDDKRVALAIVVNAGGSSPRDPGSLMAVSEDGGIAGSVSGGCIEASVVEEALDCLASGERRVISFGSESESEWEVGLPCGGGIEVLISLYDDELHGLMLDLAERGEDYCYFTSVSESSPLFGVEGVMSKGEVAGAWADPIIYDEIALAAQSLPPGASSRRLTVLGSDFFVSKAASKPTVVCVGAVHIASALVPLAKALGYRVVVVDPRKAFATRERFPEADEVINAWPQEAFGRFGDTSSMAVCVLSHDDKIDAPGLYEALRTDAFYIGCLGSPKTLLKRAEALLSRGVREEALHRVFGPIGLNIGGRNPEDIALSAMAQISAVRNGRISDGFVAAGRTIGSMRS